MRRGIASTSHHQKPSIQLGISPRSSAVKPLGSGSDGEVINGIPAPTTKKTADRCPTFESTRNLLVSRRIIDSFNVGDVTGIQKIIEDAVTIDCDICIFPLNQHLIGRAALIDAWESMLEAFPDGVFRASDTTINDKGELTTRFIFSGARQFNIILGKNSENESVIEAGEIIASVTSHNINSGTPTVPDDASHLNSDIGVNSNPAYEECASMNDSSYHMDLTVEQQEHDELGHQLSSRNSGDVDLLLCTSKLMKKSRRCTPLCRPHPLLSKSDAGTICVDYSSPLIRSADLLMDDATVKVYEGVIVMHTNESYQTSQIDYYWKAINS